MTSEKKLRIQEDAAFALRLALKRILGQIPTMFKDAGNCGTISTQCDFSHLEAEIEIALSRHDTHIKYGTNPLSHVEQGWQAWKGTKPKVKSFPDLTNSG
jgi:hypothetical protein|tara:strand:+ start:234 stop:533 length:300 start_codon:yes stop_codon:yes gene_type:complete